MHAMSTCDCVGGSCVDVSIIFSLAFFQDLFDTSSSLKDALAFGLASVWSTATHQQVLQHFLFLATFCLRCNCFYSLFLLRLFVKGLD